MATSLYDIQLSLQSMMTDDPIMKALWEGRISWGDIPGICDFTPHTFDDASDPSDPSDPSVHKTTSYTPSTIKTIITRNLPRSITPNILHNIFIKYGPIKDIYIPKNMDKSSPYFGTIKGFALIKFLNSTDSSRAYHNEYKRLTIATNHITIEFAKQDR
jgi:hypothetical protein